MEKERLINTMDYTFTFDDHIQSPEISVNQYLRSKCLDLSKAVNAKKIVYLDTKFWLIVRDVALGRSTTDGSEDFYHEIVKLSSEGRFIFPISEEVFLEITKQTDPDTLRQTVDLIDILSSGVSLINFEERLTLEIKHFLRSMSGASVYKCQEMVWTKLAYNMGFVTPSNQYIDPDMDKAIQKAFIDQMWIITLSDIISFLSEDAELCIPSMPKLSGKLNKGKFDHSHENNSFKKMFLSELYGSLDAYREVITTCLMDINEADIGNTLTEKESSDLEKQLSNAIYHLFRLNKSKYFFPTFDVISGLHAAIRWDKNQKYQDNDIHDINHAASALPYCDAFFTDKRLAHLITQKATSYDRKYSCKVASSVSESLNALQNL